MDRLVQQLGKADVDSRTFYHWADLADPLSGHHGDVRLCLRTGVPGKGAVGASSAVRNQPCSELDVHAHLGWSSEPALGFTRHFDRLGNTPLVDDRNLAALQMGDLGSSSVLRMGFDCHGAATVDHLDELGKVIT